MIVLDTHVLIWARQASTRLGRRTARRVDAAMRDGVLAVSALSFWELAMLMAAGRMGLRVTADEFRAATLGAGIVELPVDGAIAILSARLSGMQGDPADRIIVATAVAHGATLATADDKILGMRGGPARIDATT